ncbi:immunoglobulin I-set domain protein [Ancylostoma caninum]|uniref:Immunoglobulin I-set domain protein n=1 Tax=Ancylostoma caninum TaxID=29170 RepID=A0A368FY51_ANCCA|nr:immunoglobulin I-set domain protein [Ancylostoma caninum]
MPVRFVVKSLPSGLSTLRIDPVLATDNQTTVSCSADNGVANPVVADAVITVLDKNPARLVVRPDSSTVASDSRISFFCRADGNPIPNVVWKINGKPITDSRFVVKSLPSGLSTLRIDPVLATDNQTTVSCSADNGVANPVVADAVITVLDKVSFVFGSIAVLTTLLLPCFGSIIIS